MSLFREHIVKRFTRSRGWGKVRKTHVKANPYCAACGSKRKPQVHHIEDFSTNPELELDPKNLITLCMAGCKCHLTFGHLGNFKSINLNVRVDSDWFLFKVQARR